MKAKNILLPFILFTFISCSKDKDYQGAPEETMEVPTSTVDYSALGNWAFHPQKTTLLSNYALDIAVIDENLEVDHVVPITNNSGTDTGTDVFFVHPTLLTTTQNSSSIGTIPIEEQDAVQVSLTILAQGGLLAKYGRMFAPRYRQSTGITYGNSTEKKIQAEVIAESYSDIKAAFLHYLENYNNGNKILLAGHSQGSFLLALLLRDVFDNDEVLRNKLVTAALGGIGYVYAEEGQYEGGWWQNIPLCTTADECGCIQNWRSFDETQSIPEINYGLPEFNPYLIAQAFVYREFDADQDWFVQDDAYYNEQSQPLQNYITPNAGYNLGNGNNFIAFNDLYKIRQRRDDVHQVALTVQYDPLPNDQRPNDLEEAADHINYPFWGYHTKDYHIYLWALMQQIDAKIDNCP
ncbi:DUF3089 domain-containing protein [Maribacter polysaccharolyticus]|uniref:DUF3089 domain-containing protein n=1 Tax=Maribacter polysaccharolyticus TaxID=3020831 RepID=UPI00237F8D9F|nr:DUF3089 domain-containing protein [Maribacter polysaccharolyticus]MDE3743851.1 DUF3089 domain-containing protein [Maribacter polysaccharolyticus]